MYNSQHDNRLKFKLALMESLYKTTTRFNQPYVHTHTHSLNKVFFILYYYILLQPAAAALLMLFNWGTAVVYIN